jgi:hypothetical protein
VQARATLYDSGGFDGHRPGSSADQAGGGSSQRLWAAAAIPIFFTEEHGANWVGIAEQEPDLLPQKPDSSEKKGVLYAGFNKPHEFTEAEINTL